MGLLSLLLITQTFWTTGAMAAEKAVVFGTPTANIRGGPGVEHQIIVTLKENDPLVIEKLEGEWYLVTAADGLKGYMHKNLVKIAGDVQKPAAPVAKPAETPTKEAVKPPPPPAAPVVVSPQKALAPAQEPVPAKLPSAGPVPLDVKRSPTPAKAPALIQFIEGRETETLICLIVAAVAFLLGWLCGGTYSLRRDRLKRSRLNF